MTKGGTDLTEEFLDQRADEIASEDYNPVRGPGRPSRFGRPTLGGDGGPSPHVKVRPSPALYDRAAELARRRGTTISALAREALEKLVDRGAP